MKTLILSAMKYQYECLEVNAKHGENPLELGFEQWKDLLEKSTKPDASHSDDYYALDIAMEHSVGSDAWLMWQQELSSVKFNHLFFIGFTVEAKNKITNLVEPELLKSALEKRIAELGNDKTKWNEACEGPDDIYPA